MKGFFWLFFILLLLLLFLNTENNCHLGFLACFQVLSFKLFSCLVKKVKRNSEPPSSPSSCVFWK